MVLGHYSTKKHYVSASADRGFFFFFFFTYTDYGTGYAYDHRQLSIPVGDCVTWVWTTPSFVSGIEYGIYQTSTDVSKTTVSGGFASSSSSANGNTAYFCG